jgi:hypothetical protein
MIKIAVLSSPEASKISLFLFNNIFLTHIKVFLHLIKFLIFLLLISTTHTYSELYSAITKLFKSQKII